VSLFLIFFTSVVVIIDVAYYLLILNAQLGLKGSAKKGLGVLCGALIVLSIVVYNYFTNNSASSVFIAIIMLIAYSAIFTNGKWVFKLFWVGFPIILLACIEMLAFSALVTIHPDALTLDLTPSGTYYYVAASASKILQIGLLYLLVRVKLHLEQFGYYILIPLTATPIISIFYMFSLYEGMLGGRSDPAFPFRAAFAFLAVNLLLLWTIKIINNKNAIILEHQLQYQKQDLKIKNYELLYATYEKFKGYQEQVDEIMTDLWEVLKYDNSFADRETRVANYNKILFKITALQQTSNIMHCIDDEVLNMILSSRHDLAKKKGIIIEPKVVLSFEHSYDSSVIGGMLMIVLDNAIEMVDSLYNVQGDKVIALSIEVENDICEILVENPADRMIEYKSLMDHQDIALRVAKDMAARYEGGSLTTSCEDYYFSVKIVLPLPLAEIDANAYLKA